jgi:DNA-binding NarL/FixJ family response regulator
MVQAFFADVGRQSPSAILLTAVPLNAAVVADAAEVCSAAAVAVVDAAAEPAEAVAVCREMHLHRKDLPILALFCCSFSATAGHLRPLLAEGLAGLLDLHLSGEETLRALTTVARGQGVFHLQFGESSGSALSELLNRNSADELSEFDVALLRLLASGQTDQEIGRNMYLSPHTVKHRIERLRRLAQARNRVQLAAWAARQGAVRTVLLAIVIGAEVIRSTTGPWTP